MEKEKENQETMEPEKKRAKKEEQKSVKDRWKEANVVVVGLSGKIGSGKTTAAEMIKAVYPTTIIRNFADRLKELVAIHLEIDVALCYSHEGKNMYLPEYGITLGEFLQQWGTKLREVNENIWVLAVQSFIDACVAKKKNKEEKLIIVIGDARFVNEAEWLQKVGGITVRLEGDPGKEREKSKRDVNHVSEVALDEYTAFDLVINTEITEKESTGEQILEMIESK